MGSSCNLIVHWLNRSVLWKASDYHVYKYMWIGIKLFGTRDFIDSLYWYLIDIMLHATTTSKYTFDIRSATMRIFFSPNYFSQELRCQKSHRASLGLSLYFLTLPSTKAFLFEERVACEPEVPGRRQSAGEQVLHRQSSSSLLYYNNFVYAHFKMSLGTNLAILSFFSVINTICILYSITLLRTQTCSSSSVCEQTRGDIHIQLDVKGNWFKRNLQYVKWDRLKPHRPLILRILSTISCYHLSQYFRYYWRFLISHFLILILFFSDFCSGNRSDN